MRYDVRNKMTPEEQEKFIMEHLSKVFEMAQHDALVEVVTRIADAVGVTELEGMSVGELYERRRRAISEDLVRDYADTNVAMASKVKELWDKLDSGNL